MEPMFERWRCWVELARAYEFLVPNDKIIGGFIAGINGDVLYVDTIND